VMTGRVPVCLCSWTNSVDCRQPGDPLRYCHNGRTVELTTPHRVYGPCALPMLSLLFVVLVDGGLMRMRLHRTCRGWQPSTVSAFP
jgi:hypothetical protein